MTIDLDLDLLDTYLATHLGASSGPLRGARMAGGASNPTYMLDRPEGSTMRRYVLRKKPSGVLLPSAHQVEREYRIMAALRATPVPVPKVRFLCEDPAIIGTPFYVMDFLPGRIFRDAALPGLDRADRRRVYEGLIDTLALLHAIDPHRVGLGELGRSGGFYARQIARWTKQYRAAESESIPAMERLIDELPRRMPAEDMPRLVHGDFRLENLMFEPDRSAPLALLDWELCTLGDPLADLAYSCIGYHADLDFFGTLQGVDLAASGIPSETEQVERYCAAAGLAEIRNWGFYLAFSLFRLAAIAQGVFRRGQDGQGTGHPAGTTNTTGTIAAFATAVIDIDRVGERYGQGG